MGFDIKVTLDTVKLKNLERSCKGLAKRHIKMGWFDKKFYPSSHPNKGIYIAQVAAWQEFGLGGNSERRPIPARPYFRQAIRKVETGYTPHFIKIFKQALNGEDTLPALNKLSFEFVKDYSESVLMQNYPKLAPYTVALKGHSYQMDDSGVMIENFKAKVFRTSLDNSGG